MIIVTRGHRDDMRVLRWAVTTPARYIAMIGSKRKTISVVHELEKEGLPREAFDKVFAPMGLGACSPMGSSAIRGICKRARGGVSGAAGRDGVGIGIRVDEPIRDGKEHRALSGAVRILDRHRIRIRAAAAAQEG